jgi:hypothetical protein
LAHGYQAKDALPRFPIAPHRNSIRSDCVFFANPLGSNAGLAVASIFRNQPPQAPFPLLTEDRRIVMADQKITEDATEALEKQIAELKRQVGRINKTLSEQASEAVEEAKGWYDSASSRASRAASAVRAQAHTVSEVAQENPVTVSTAALAIGFVGFMIGFACGQSTSNSHRYWR